jgi:hypothetical protein
MFPRRLRAMRVQFREYKVILDGSLFTDLNAGCLAVLDDLGDLARTLGSAVAGEFDAEDPKERTVLFLDTPDFTLRRNRLLLRQRVKKSGKTTYTLKCRDEDRYIAAGQPLAPGPGFTPEVKFEEDIGVPFVSRFSHSASIDLDAGAAFAGDDLPPTLAKAARLFPALASVRRDGMACPPETPLAVVNATKVFEQVYEGPTLRFTPAPAEATLALVLWRKTKKGRLLTAEFSFRCEDQEEAFPLAVALAARRFFEGVQRADWARPDAITKTQYMYGG